MHSDPTEIDMDKPPLHATKKNWGKKKKQFENSLMSFGPKFLNCLHCENLRLVWVRENNN